MIQLIRERFEEQLALSEKGDDEAGCLLMKIS
jgi:hypothetical protein